VFVLKQIVCLQIFEQIFKRKQAIFSLTDIGLMTPNQKQIQLEFS